MKNKVWLVPIGAGIGLGLLSWWLSKQVLAQQPQIQPECIEGTEEALEYCPKPYATTVKRARRCVKGVWEEYELPCPEIPTVYQNTPINIGGVDYPIYEIPKFIYDAHKVEYEFKTYSAYWTEWRSVYGVVAKTGLHTSEPRVYIKDTYYTKCAPGEDIDWKKQLLILHRFYKHDTKTLNYTALELLITEVYPESFQIPGCDVVDMTCEKIAKCRKYFPDVMRVNILPGFAVERMMYYHYYTIYKEYIANFAFGTSSTVDGVVGYTAGRTMINEIASKLTTFTPEGLLTPLPSTVLGLINTMTHIDTHHTDIPLEKRINIYYGIGLSATLLDTIITDHIAGWV